MRWDPTQYERYADDRGRPFHDLLARVAATDPHRVVDVGCGPGTLTAGLAQRWPTAMIEGLDSSAEMIETASALADDRVSFRLEDAATWIPPVDIDMIISNATLQWVPDHQPIVARWAAALRVGGWLAFQVPGNFGSPSHTIMRELAESPRWRGSLEGVLRHADAVAEPSVYDALLRAAGLVADVWETTYLHLLAGEDPVLQWVRGTGLRPVLTALSKDDAAEFETQYGALLREAYPPTPQGTVFSFRRIFAVGHSA